MAARRIYYVDTWEARMRSAVRRWGNSAAVRIPARVMEAARLSFDQAVEVREEQGRIVIEPLHRQDYDLSGLIAAITDENRHEEFDFGPPVGRESL
jgi:antitoxin MazE